MEFGWTADQTEKIEAVTAFAAGRLNRGGPPGTFRRDLWRELADFGVHGLRVPEEYGGGAEHPLTTVALLEALGAGCRDSGLLFSLSAHMWACQEPVLRFGTDAQKARYLPGMCDGTLIGAHAATEAEAGSDAMGVTTTAEYRDGGWVLSGSKTYVTNGPVADVFVVSARTGPSRSFGVSVFLVDRDTPGLVVGEPLGKLGLESSPTSVVHFNDCVLPPDALLGRKGGGLGIFRSTMRAERSFILAPALGAMRRELDAAVAHCRTRRQFGQEIGKFQAVSRRLVDMRIRMETSRLLLYRLGWLHGGDAPVSDADAALVKLHVSEALCAFSLDLMQVYGGAGYLRDTGVEQLVRDALGSQFYSGTSDIQANIIALDMGL
ncbi:acyl-CoA dehydrogenase family protein [Longispora urticae]